ncbi:MAG: cadherin-like domain-containing protein [Anaerolineales bacterium]|nr:cadherin-like domain-containing protein [Anaerolineales bacterium]
MLGDDVLVTPTFALHLHATTVPDGGQLWLTVENMSDEAQTVQVSARQPEDALRFQPADQHVPLAPRGTADVRIAVQARGRQWLRPDWWLGRTTHEFDVAVASVEDQQQVRAQLSTTPSPLFWLLMIGGLFLILGCLIVGSFYLLGQSMAARSDAVTDALETRATQQSGAAATNAAVVTAVAATNEALVTAVMATNVALMTAVAPTPPGATPIPSATPLPAPSQTAVPPASQTPTPQTLPPFAFDVSADSVLNRALRQLILDAIGRDYQLFTFPAPPLQGEFTPGTDGAFVYRPGSDYYVFDTFTYLACDAAGGCVTGAVNLRILRPSPTRPNSTPAADNDTLTFTEDSPERDITADLLAGDADAESVALRIVGVAEHDPERVLFNEATGAVRYNPGDFFDALVDGDSATDSFRYRVRDEAGAENTAIVTIHIQGKNDSPVARDDGAGGQAGFVVTEDAVSGDLTAGMLSNDTDVDTGQTAQLRIHAVSNDAAGGEAVAFASGRWRYEPGGAYEALAEGETAVDTFFYAVVDPAGAISNQATVQITIQGVNDPPALTITNLSAPVPFSPTVGAAHSVRIATDVTLTDVDSAHMDRLEIRFAGSGPRLDGADEYVRLDFEGSDIRSTDDFLIVQPVPFPAAAYVAALESVVYVNQKAAPTAGCRRITFQVFDDAGAGSNVVTVDVQVGSSVCPAPAQTAVPDTAPWALAGGTPGRWAHEPA